MTLRAFRKDGREVRPGDTVTNFRGVAGTFERATRAPDAGRTGKVLVSGAETYMTVWDLTVREVAAETLGGPAVTPVGAAEIRVFAIEPPYDRSDMYVIDVLGATVLLRMSAEDPEDENSPSRLKIMIEADGVFIVGVNEDENVYGDAVHED